MLIEALTRLVLLHMRLPVVLVFAIKFVVGFTAGQMVSPEGDAHGGPSSYPQERQPAANPAAEQPSDGASGWRSFEEDVLLEPMPSSNSNESSEASVNQQPVIPELEPPLLDDNTRREELTTRLRGNWWGYVYDETHVDSFVQIQLAIDRHVEATLVADGYSPQVIFERRDQIRGFVFYPGGSALGEGTYAGYLNQITNLGTRQSVPYKRVIRAVRNSNLLLD